MSRLEGVQLTELYLKRQVRAAVSVLLATLIGACTPVYMSDTYTRSTPIARSFIGNLNSNPVAVLGTIAPANLQGFGPSLSLALVNALAQTQPPIRMIPAYQAASILNEQGVGKEYAELLSSYSPGGILERQRLRRIGSVLHSRYLLLPGLAEFNQLIMDKYETMGVKLVRTRVTTLRVWLQLWDSQTGRILWESTGELTAVTALLNAKRTVPFDQLAQKLCAQMIQEDLIGAKTESRIFLSDWSTDTPDY
jgi:hypothetical protein